MKIFFLFFLFIVSCSNSKQKAVDATGLDESMVSASDFDGLDKSLEVIEIIADGDYPEKTINLEDIAEVRYVPLETTDQSLIQGIHKMATSDDKIVICDLAQNTIFIFDKDGHYINSINKKGPGPQDYSTIHNFAVDFQKKEIYICDYQLKYRILTYSFNGEFIRESKLDQKIWPSTLYNYDEKFLIAYDTYNMDSGEGASIQPYSLIKIHQTS